MGRILRRILDVISVRPCIVCSRAVKISESLNLCPECRNTIQRYGKTAFSSGGVTVSVLPYEKHIRKAIHKFKFSNKKYYGYTFGKLISDRIKTFDWCDELECVACVGMKGRNRLYNQAAVIAENVANELGIPFLENALIKIKDIPPFYKLKADERAKAVRGAFKAGDEKEFNGKCVLLIDDVSTTGTTLGECRHILLRAGATKVYCATACYVVPDSKYKRTNKK